jgi:hypothetical protein
MFAGITIMHMCIDVLYNTFEIFTNKHTGFAGDRDLHENIEKSKAVHSKVETVINMDDYALLKESSLTMDQIEGVFTNPPPTQPR